LTSAEAIETNFCFVDFFDESFDSKGMPLSSEQLKLVLWLCMAFDVFAAIFMIGLLTSRTASYEFDMRPRWIARVSIARLISESKDGQVWGTP